MRTMKPLITAIGAAALLAATVVPAVAQDTEGSDAQSLGTMQYTPLITCYVGQADGFDMAPCPADDAGLHADFHAPFELSGMLDGVGSMGGVFSLRSDDTFYSDATAIFVGEVEGCGTGTVNLQLAGIEGFYNEDGVPVWTVGTWEVVAGGSVPVGGSFETLGTETVIVPYTTGALDYAGELTCDAVA